MVLAERLRALRVGKHFSQRDLQERTGLLRCYVSRVENGHTAPSIETLERLARALEVPLYQLFREGDLTPQVPTWSTDEESVWGKSGKSVSDLDKLRRSLEEMKDTDRQVLLSVARMMASRNRENK
jgi:transcriptional regulator with XRE-family HTH domain